MKNKINEQQRVCKYAVNIPIEVIKQQYNKIQKLRQLLQKKLLYLDINKLIQWYNRSKKLK